MKNGIFILTWAISLLFSLDTQASYDPSQVSFILSKNNASPNKSLKKIDFLDGRSIKEYLNDLTVEEKFRVADAFYNILENPSFSPFKVGDFRMNFSPGRYIFFNPDETYSLLNYFELGFEIHPVFTPYLDLRGTTGIRLVHMRNTLSPLLAQYEQTLASNLKDPKKWEKLELDRDLLGRFKSGLEAHLKKTELKRIKNDSDPDLSRNKISKILESFKAPFYFPFSSKTILNGKNFKIGDVASIMLHGGVFLNAGYTLPGTNMGSSVGVFLRGLFQIILYQYEKNKIRFTLQGLSSKGIRADLIKGKYKIEIPLKGFKFTDSIGTSIKPIIVGHESSREKIFSQTFEFDLNTAIGRRDFDLALTGNLWKTFTHKNTALLKPIVTKKIQHYAHHDWTRIDLKLVKITNNKESTIEKQSVNYGVGDEDLYVGTSFVDRAFKLRGFKSKLIILKKFMVNVLDPILNRATPEPFDIRTRIDSFYFNNKKSKKGLLKHLGRLDRMIIFSGFAPLNLPVIQKQERVYTKLYLGKDYWKDFRTYYDSKKTDTILRKIVGRYDLGKAIRNGMISKNFFDNTHRKIEALHESNDPIEFLESGNSLYETPAVPDLLQLYLLSWGYENNIDFDVTKKRTPEAIYTTFVTKDHKVKDDYYEKSPTYPGKIVEGEKRIPDITLEVLFDQDKKPKEFKISVPKKFTDKDQLVLGLSHVKWFKENWPFSTLKIRADSAKSIGKNQFSTGFSYIYPIPQLMMSGLKKTLMPGTNYVLRAVAIDEKGLPLYPEAKMPFRVRSL